MFIRSYVILYRYTDTSYEFRTAKPLFLLPGAENTHVRLYQYAERNAYTQRRPVCFVKTIENTHPFSGRRQFLALLGLVGVSGLAGCLDSADDETDDGDETEYPTLRDVLIRSFVSIFVPMSQISVCQSVLLAFCSTMAVQSHERPYDDESPSGRYLSMVC